LEEEREEEFCLDERLVPEREDALFELREERLFEEETLLLREEDDLEEEERYLEDEDELLEVRGLTELLALEAPERTERVV
jgi:hypothetical protein